MRRRLRRSHSSCAGGRGSTIPATHVPDFLSFFARLVSQNSLKQTRYDLVNTEIRKHDPDHLVLFESVTWEIVGIGEQFGFTHSPGGEQWVNKWVNFRFLGLHVYFGLTSESNLCCGFILIFGVDLLLGLDQPQHLQVCVLSKFCEVDLSHLGRYSLSTTQSKIR